MSDKTNFNMDNESVDWEKIKEWDEKYYFHIQQTPRTYRHIPVASAEGAYFYLADGTKMLDFISQTQCSSAGQQNPRIKKKIKEAMDKYSYISLFLVNEYRAQAAKLLIEDILSEDDWAGRVMFRTSGSEAMDMALVAARLFTSRRNIICVQGCFHGSTMGSGGGATWIRGYGSGLSSDTDETLQHVPGYHLSGFYVIPAPNCLHCPVGHSYPECKTKLPRGILPCVHTSRSLMMTIGPETIAALVTEGFASASGLVPPPEYNPQIYQITRELGILWIDDEVVNGFGRTGKWFSYQWFKNLKPDIMVLGKALSNMAISAGAMVANKEISRFLTEGRWWLGGTAMGHPIAMAAIVGTLETYIEDRLIERAVKMGTFLKKRLQNLEKSHRCVGRISGEGMLWAVDLVKNKQTRELFVKEDRDVVMGSQMENFPAKQVFESCFKKGLFIGGFAPNTFFLLPPFVITEEDCDKAMEILDEALTEFDKLCQ